MENVILSIIKELLGISIGFVGLIFASFSILMTLSDDNWKIKKLKKSKRYETFIKSVSNLGIGFLLLFVFSVIILILDPIIKTNYSVILQYILYTYLLALFVLLIKMITVLNKFKKIVILFADKSKPKLEMNNENE